MWLTIFVLKKQPVLDKSLLFGELGKFLKNPALLYTMYLSLPFPSGNYGT
jgi:hypothetical protein